MGLEHLLQGVIWASVILSCTLVAWGTERVVWNRAMEKAAKLCERWNAPLLAERVRGLKQ